MGNEKIEAPVNIKQELLDGITIARLQTIIRDAHSELDLYSIPRTENNHTYTLSARIRRLVATSRGDENEWNKTNYSETIHTKQGNPCVN